MDDSISNHDPDGADHHTDEGSTSVPAGETVGLIDERAGGRSLEPARRTSRRGPNSLIFVFVLTGVGMVFAILVVLWMYWLQGIVPA